MVSVRPPSLFYLLGLFSWRSRARRSAMTWSGWVSPWFCRVLGFCLASKAAIRLARYETEVLKEDRREGRRHLLTVSHSNRF